MRLPTTGQSPLCYGCRKRECWYERFCRVSKHNTDGWCVLRVLYNTVGRLCRKGTLSIWNRHKANQTLEKPPWNDIHSRRIDLTSSQEYHGLESWSMLPWRTGCAHWAFPLLAKAEELVNMLDTVCLQPKVWKKSKYLACYQCKQQKISFRTSTSTKCSVDV